MRNPKLLAFPMIVMLGLLSTGLVYAHWTKTLYVYGHVDTGELDWQFTSALILDTSGDDFHCYDNFQNQETWQGNKDVGSSSIVVTDPHTVTVILDNVYPSYFTMASVYARNTGNIALIIDNVIINGEVVLSEWPTVPVQLDLDDDGFHDIEIWWLDGFGTQLEPDDPAEEMSFWIHVLQDAPEGIPLYFTIEIVAVQWNYEPPG